MKANQLLANRAEYRRHARRVIVALVLLFGLWAALRGTARSAQWWWMPVYDWLLLIMVFPGLGVPVWFLQRSQRRLELLCPSCGLSFINMRPEIDVVETGRCPRCSHEVLEHDHAA
jgi:DNA-directed RNA polymerase subunit RPC12/RpoP